MGNQNNERRQVFLQALQKASPEDGTDHPRVALFEFELLESILLLREIFQDKELPPEIRARAARFLGLLNHQESFELLVRILQTKEEHILTRKGAIFGLGYLKNMRALEPLTLALEDEEIANEAIIALGYSQLPQAFEILFGILQRKDETAQRLYLFALDGLSTMNDERGFPLLLSLFWELADLELRRFIAYKLSFMYEKLSLETYIKILKEETDIEIKEEFIAKLTGYEKFKDKQVLTWMIKTLRHFDDELVKAVSRSLIHIGDASAVEVLIETLKHPNLTVRKNAIIALGRIGDSRALTVLSNIAENDTNIVDEIESLASYAQDAVELIRHPLQSEQL